MDDAFGIGSFHLGVHPQAPRKLTWGQHWTNVSAALREIGAEDIEIAYDPDDETETVFWDGFPEATLQEGGGVTPPGSFTDIDFALPIPRAFVQSQKELHHMRPAQAGYQVSIRYGYETPVAVITSPDPDDPQPSNGVVYAREYLKNRLADSQLVRFEYIGPSPFHADCRLGARAPNSLEDETILCELLQARGYDERRFTYDPSAVTFSRRGRSSSLSSPLTSRRTARSITSTRPGTANGMTSMSS